MSAWFSLRFLLKWFHWLSLDVVFGAIGGYGFACYSLGVTVSVPPSFILGLSVWIIYLCDHLWDSYRFQPNKISKYHIFSRHQPVFVCLILLLAAIDAFLIFYFLPWGIIIPGAILSFSVILYLFLQHILSEKLRPRFPKEIIISIIYILSVWLIPMMETRDIKTGLLFIHFLLVFINVLIFSYFERNEDLANHSASLFSHITVSKFRIVIAGLCLIALVLSLIFINSTLTTIIFTCIALIYVVQIVCAGHPFVKKHYAAITDGVFVLFMLFVFLG